jgi:hypothetical protein
MVQPRFWVWDVRVPVPVHEFLGNWRRACRIGGHAARSRTSGRIPVSLGFLWQKPRPGRAPRNRRPVELACAAATSLAQGERTSAIALLEHDGCNAVEPTKSRAFRLAWATTPTPYRTWAHRRINSASPPALDYRLHPTQAHRTAVWAETTPTGCLQPRTCPRSKVTALQPPITFCAFLRGNARGRVGLVAQASHELFWRV